MLSPEALEPLNIAEFELTVVGGGVTTGGVTVYVIVGTATTALGFEAASFAMTLKLLAPGTRLTETDQ